MATKLPLFFKCKVTLASNYRCRRHGGFKDTEVCFSLCVRLLLSELIDNFDPGTFSFQMLEKHHANKLDLLLLLTAITSLSHITVVFHIVKASLHYCERFLVAMILEIY